MSTLSTHLDSKRRQSTGHPRRKITSGLALAVVATVASNLLAADPPSVASYAVGVHGTAGATNASVDISTELRELFIPWNFRRHEADRNHLSATVLPFDLIDVDQLQVGLVHQGGRLKGVTDSLTRHIPTRESSELVVHERRERLERRFIAGTPGHEELRDLRRGRCRNRAVFLDRNSLILS